MCSGLLRRFWRVHPSVRKQTYFLLRCSQSRHIVDDLPSAILLTAVSCRCRYSLKQLHLRTYNLPWPSRPYCKGSAHNGRRTQTVTGSLWKSIQQCWCKDPHSRPGAPEVLQILFNSSVPRSPQRSFEDLIIFPSLGTLLHGNG